MGIQLPTTLQAPWGGEMPATCHYNFTLQSQQSCKVQSAARCVLQTSKLDNAVRGQRLPQRGQGVERLWAVEHQVQRRSEGVVVEKLQGEGHERDEALGFKVHKLRLSSREAYAARGPHILALSGNLRFLRGVLHTQEAIAEAAVMWCEPDSREYCLDTNISTCASTEELAGRRVSRAASQLSVPLWPRLNVPLYAWYQSIAATPIRPANVTHALLAPQPQALEAVVFQACQRIAQRQRKNQPLSTADSEMLAAVTRWVEGTCSALAAHGLHGRSPAYELHGSRALWDARTHASQTEHPPRRRHHAANRTCCCFVEAAACPSSIYTMHLERSRKVVQYDDRVCDMRPGYVDAMLSSSLRSWPCSWRGAACAACCWASCP